MITYNHTCCEYSHTKWLLHDAVNSIFFYPKDWQNDCVYFDCFTHSKYLESKNILMIELQCSGLNWQWFRSDTWFIFNLDFYRGDKEECFLVILSWEWERITSQNKAIRGFGRTWVNENWSFILGWTVPLIQACVIIWSAAHTSLVWHIALRGHILRVIFSLGIKFTLTIQKQLH